MTSAKFVPVLMHHHVSPSPGMITVAPDIFEDQLAWLARDGWTSLSAAQFSGFLAGQAVPEKSVLITFDDGYLDNWVYAHPLLQRYGMRAVLFQVTGWTHDGPVRPCLGSGGSLPETPEHRACEAMIEAGQSDAVIARWSELQAMVAAGTFEIHSHTHTHTRWDKRGLAPDERRARLREDLLLSRADMDRHLGGATSHLCWPQGYFDPDYVEVARECGFDHLYTTHAFGRNLPHGDPLHIYRFAISNRPANWLRQRFRYHSHPLISPLFNRFKAWKKGLPPGA
ncbi:polysaccharide deacetylase family protein [Kerstersia similis]|uniref:polysaccharide deacetylase family protein n=1 Tax=Kerstersia similis TaxID=206505 RepID=UPI0039F1045F